MFGTQDFLIDCENPLEKGFCLRITALLSIKPSKPVRPRGFAF
jgi:hypothetical protein